MIEILAIRNDINDLHYPLPWLKPWAIKQFHNDRKFEMEFIALNLNNSFG